jgi:serine/threonine protein kinase
MPSQTTTTLGRYRILAEIGRGAMGVVYKARDPKIDRLVAIKAVSLFGQEPEDEADYRERFFVEAQAAGRLSHPGIVTIFDVGEEPGNHDPYIVMEYVAGQSLSRVLTGQNKKLPLHAALQIAQELAEALDYAHSQGVVHRDIKPANIMVTMEGHAKIADFGIAKLNHAHMTLPGQVLGSPAYMAPEQLNGESADARSDLFSLGVILYNMVTGFKPFQGNSATTVCFKVVNRDPLPASAYDTGLPSQIDRIVERAMAKDPAQRYQTGAEMARDIQALRQNDKPLYDATTFFKKVVQEQVGFSNLRGSSTNGRPVPASRRLSTGTGFSKNAPGKGGAIGTSIISRASLPRRKLIYGALVTLLLATGLITYETAHLRNSKGLKALALAARNPAISQTASSRISENAAQSIRDQVNRAATPDATDAADSIPASLDKKKQQPPASGQTPASESGHQSHRLLPSARPVGAALTAQRGWVKLHLHIEHPFVDAEVSIWMDNSLIQSRTLVGETKKRALLFHQTAGHDSETLELPAGRHQLHVRIQSTADAYDQSKTVAGDFTAGSERVLQITCDKHGDDLQVTLK